MSKSPLSAAERQRYNRQLLLPTFGFDGQERLRASTVLMIGAGGLGCAAAQYLAATGIGRLVLVDFDHVAAHNLPRQILYRDADVGRPKALVAAAALTALNPHASVEGIVDRLDDEALLALMRHVDLVLDCSDNLATREQLNRLCHRAGKALISAAAIRLEGQIAIFPMTPEAPCYHCLSHRFGEQPLSCLEAGVLAPVVGIIGAMQALEAIMWLTAADPVAAAGRLMLFDGARGEWRDFRLAKWPACPVCSDKGIRQI